jgi:hypothetical protein
VRGRLRRLELVERLVPRLRVDDAAGHQPGHTVGLGAPASYSAWVRANPAFASVTCDLEEASAASDRRPAFLAWDNFGLGLPDQGRLLLGLFFQLGHRQFDEELAGLDPGCRCR